MRTRQAVNHDVFTFSQRFIEEAVGRLEEGDDLLRCVERRREHVLANAVPEVSKALVALEEVFTLTSLSVDDVEYLVLLKDIQVLCRADVSDVEFGASFRVDPDDIWNIVLGKLSVSLHGWIGKI